MAACNPGVHVTDFAVRHQLGFFQGALNRFDGRFNIDHHAFFQTFRFRLAQANHFMPTVGHDLGHHGDHLGGADIESDD